MSDFSNGKIKILKPTDTKLYKLIHANKKYIITKQDKLKKSN